MVRQVTKGSKAHRTQYHQWKLYMLLLLLPIRKLLSNVRNKRPYYQHQDSSDSGARPTPVFSFEEEQCSVTYSSTDVSR